MLERYVRAVQAPGIAPQHPVFQPTICHPDLNTANIITTSGVDNAIGLRSLIDWQHACIIPACMIPPIPACFAYLGDRIAVPEGRKAPVLPDDFDSLPPDVKSEVEWEWNMARIQKVYTVATELLPIRNRIAKMPHRDALLLLYAFADQCWAAHFIHLRFWLACLQVRWPGSAECPINFTEDEVTAAEELYTELTQYEAECELICDEIGCTDDGEMKGATQSEIEAARARCTQLAAQWNEDEHGGPFPLRAGSAASMSRQMGD